MRYAKGKRHTAAKALQREMHFAEVNANQERREELMFMVAGFLKRQKNEKKKIKILPSYQIHITIHLTLKVGSNPSHATPYFILG